MNECLKLIKEFLNEVEKGLRFFDKKYGRRDIMIMLRDGIIPRKGKVGPGVKYSIHGIGCIFEYLTYFVNFDFGEGLRSDAFCDFTLHSYARHFPDRFPNCQDSKHLKFLFDKLIESGMVETKSSEFNNLYYLTEKGELEIPKL